MDDDVIPHPTIVLVKSEPLEHESEHHAHPFTVMVMTVYSFESFFTQFYFIPVLYVCVYMRVYPKVSGLS
jgi:hypothetical protein